MVAVSSHEALAPWPHTEENTYSAFSRLSGEGRFRTVLQAIKYSVNSSAEDNNN